MDLIHREGVIRRIEMYFEGEAMKYATPIEWKAFESTIAHKAEPSEEVSKPQAATN